MEGKRKISEKELAQILGEHRRWADSKEKGKRAHLNEADLGGASLTEANLRAADLRKVDLSYAELRKADLSYAELRRANLTSADLSDADLRSASLINADLSGADLSGACLDDANLSGWIIKDIICTHIMQRDQRIDFAPGEFEKKYTWLESVAEVVLDLPLSDVTYYAGQMMAAVVGRRLGAASGGIVLRSMQAQSNDSTRLEFLVFQKELFDLIRQAMEQIQEALREQSQDLKALLAPLEAEPEAIGLRQSMPIPFTPYEWRPRDVEEILNRRHAQMSQPLQRLAEIIDSAARKILP
ncbi:MAG: pentapeptide repeat-containing protein [Desulfarculus sp.]|nr:pentapeptide repeat-containing protein [Desulfarculus sp.]